MEAGRNVKAEGKENNLLELIAADPAFPMGLEEPIITYLDREAIRSQRMGLRL